MKHTLRLLEVLLPTAMALALMWMAPTVTADAVSTPYADESAELETPIGPDGVLEDEHNDDDDRPDICRGDDCPHLRDCMDLESPRCADNDHRHKKAQDPHAGLWIAVIIIGALGTLTLILISRRS